jgi:hypothetical protein
MAQDAVDNSASQDDGAAPAPPRRKGWRMVLALLVLVVIAGTANAWFSRERIAGNVIAGQIEGMGLPATYRIVSIGTRRQVLADIVVGDPARPDLTVERVDVEIVPRFGVPGIGRITLVKPRLYGSYLNGKLSFGGLDTVLFGGGGKQPFQLPDLDLAIEDARGLLETEWGPVGFKAEGAGRLRDGFAGVLAATAPQARAGGCRLERGSVYGTVRIAAGQPRFMGPLRLAALDCGAGGAAIAGAAIQLDTGSKPWAAPAVSSIASKH